MIVLKHGEYKQIGIIFPIGMYRPFSLYLHTSEIGN